jgi:hypothetical protein
VTVNCPNGVCQVKYLAAPQARVANGASFQETTVDPSETCDALPLGDIVNMTDGRGNNQVYRVKKMADNHCWMIDNLKLAPATEDGTLTISSTDTNLTTGSFTIGGEVHDATSHAHGICVGGTVSGTGKYLTCDSTSNENATNSQFSAYTDITQYNTWCNNSSNWPSGSLTGCGYFYDLYTASAGTANFKAETTMAGDICPGSTANPTWHIPVGPRSTSTNEYALLNGMMNGDGAASTSTDQAHANNWYPTGAWQGAFSGSYTGGFNNQGSTGYYWSSSVSYMSSTTLRFDSSSVRPAFGSGNTPGNGLAVRCMV